SHVRGQGGRGSVGGRSLQGAAPPVHAGAAAFHPTHRPRRHGAAPPGDDSRNRAHPPGRDRPGLPLRSTLPLREIGVHRERPSAQGSEARAQSLLLALLEDTMAETPLLQVKNLKKYYPIRGGLFSREVARVHAVDDVSFTIQKGETLGLVGESGCGKSTTGRCILRLIEPTAGEVNFEGKDVTALDKRSLRHLRRDMQIIFQDPYASLNPRMTVGSIIGEALVIHKLAKTKREREERVIHLLETVGLGADHL